MPYEADIIRQPGSLIDGDMKLQAKVEVLYFETPDSKGQKAGSAIVKAWTPRGLERAGNAEARKIMHRFAMNQSEVIERKIERKVRAAQAQGVSLE